MNKKLRRLLIITPALLLIPGLLIAGCSSDSQSPSIATIGKPAPDFTLQNLDGEMINFWNTGCPPCRNEMPYLQEVYDENRDTGLVLLTINIGQSVSTVEDFLEENNLALPVLLDSDGDVTQRYGMPGIPTTFFIDENGIIVENS